jgi:hypothetical protein
MVEHCEHIAFLENIAVRKNSRAWSLNSAMDARENVAMQYGFFA